VPAGEHQEEALRQASVVMEPGLVYWQLRCLDCGAALLIVHAEGPPAPRVRFCVACGAPGVFYRLPQ
jgi:hypothetical protein